MSERSTSFSDTQQEAEAQLPWSEIVLVIEKCKLNVSHSDWRPEVVMGQYVFHAWVNGAPTFVNSQGCSVYYDGTFWKVRIGPVNPDTIKVLACCAALEVDSILPPSGTWDDLKSAGRAACLAWTPDTKVVVTVDSPSLLPPGLGMSYSHRIKQKTEHVAGGHTRESAPVDDVLEELPRFHKNRAVNRSADQIVVIVTESTWLPNKMHGTFEFAGWSGGFPVYANKRGCTIYSDGNSWKARIGGLPSSGDLGDAPYCAGVVSTDTVPPEGFWKSLEEGGQHRRMRVCLFDDDPDGSLVAL